MRKILLFAVVLSILTFASNSYGFSNKGENCTKCHTLKKEEATALLKKIDPNIKVFNVKPTPLKSMWEIEVESSNKKVVVYIDITKRYLFSGLLIDLNTKKNLTEEANENLIRINVSTVPLDDAIVIGDRNAKKRVIVFTDPDCPFCAKLHPELKKIAAERKDIAFFIKMFPLPIHKEAAEKAKAIVCGKSLALLDAAFEKKPLAKAKCKTSAVDSNIALAKKLGITATPTLIMPDGRVISGFRDANALKATIDKK